MASRPTVFKYPERDFLHGAGPRQIRLNDVESSWCSRDVPEMFQKVGSWNMQRMEWFGHVRPSLPTVFLNAGAPSPSLVKKEIRKTIRFERQNHIKQEKHCLTNRRFARLSWNISRFWSLRIALMRPAALHNPAETGDVSLYAFLHVPSFSYKNLLLSFTFLRDAAGDIQLLITISNHI